MLTPSTRPRGDNNLPARLGRTDGSVDLLARRINNQQKQKAAATATGGVVGITFVYSDSLTVNTLVTTHTLRAAGLDVSGYDNFPQTEVSTDPTAYPGLFTIDNEGIYSFRMISRVNLDKSGGVPAVMRVQLWSSLSWNDYDKIMPTFDGSAAGVPNGTTSTGEIALWDDWMLGPRFVEAGELFDPRYEFKTTTAPIIGPNDAAYVLEVTRYATQD